MSLTKRETAFYKRHYIFEPRALREFSKDRLIILNKMQTNGATIQELMEHITVGKNVIDTCKKAIQIKDDISEKNIDSQVLADICKYVLSLYEYTTQFFKPGRCIIWEYTKFCQNNVEYIEINEIEILVTVVSNRKDVYLWAELMRLYIAFGCQDTLSTMFEKSYQSLTQNSLPIWKMMAKHYEEKLSQYSGPTTTQDYNSLKLEVKKLYEKGSKSIYRKVAFGMRAGYLAWCYRGDGIIGARKIFHEKLKSLPSTSYGLYLQMIEYERNLVPIHENKIGELYEEACNLFGEKNLAPWVKSVEFEFLFGTRKKAKQVYLAALIRLEPPLRDIMIKKYDELLDKFQKNYPNCQIAQEIIVIDD